MDPDPDQMTPRSDLTPGLTRSSLAMLHEWYDEWATDPAPGQVFGGLYHDSSSGYWTGWEIAHDFAPNHWTTFDFSPGIYWGSIGLTTASTTATAWCACGRR